MTRPLEMHEIHTEHFSATVHEAPRCVMVELVGNADQMVRDQVQVLLAEVHEQGKRCGADEIVIDVRELYFMNSSCLSVLMRWITGLTKIGGARCRVRFTTNPNLRWQRRSLQAMATLGNGLVVVE